MAGGIGGLPSPGSEGAHSRSSPATEVSVRSPSPGLRRPGACGRAIRELPPAERPRERLQLRGRGRPHRGRADRAAVGLGIAGRSAIDVATDAIARFDGLTGLARASGPELEAVPGIGEARAAQLAGRVRARAAAARRLAGGPLVDPVAARRRGPPGAPDGPPRARGAAGRDPEHEERRAPRRDGLPGQRQRVAGPGRRAVPRRRPARRRGRDPRPQPPIRRPDAVARTTCT